MARDMRKKRKKSPPLVVYFFLPLGDPGLLTQSLAFSVLIMAIRGGKK